MVDNGIVLRTARLKLEPMSDRELAALVEQYMDSVPELSGAYQEMLDSCIARPQERVWYTSWKICRRDDGKRLGAAGFKGLQEDGSAEIGYGLDAEYEHHGYAAEGVKALVDWVFSKPEVGRLEAEADEANLASIRLLEGLGFSPNGVLGEEGPRFVLTREQWCSRL